MLTALISIVVTALIFLPFGLWAGWRAGNRHYGRKIRRELNRKHGTFRNNAYNEYIDGFQDGLLFAEGVVDEQKGLI